MKKIIFAVALLIITNQIYPEKKISAEFGWMFTNAFTHFGEDIINTKCNSGLNIGGRFQINDKFALGLNYLEFGFARPAHYTKADPISGIYNEKWYHYNRKRSSMV